MFIERTPLLYNICKLVTLPGLCGGHEQSTSMTMWSLLRSLGFCRIRCQIYFHCIPSHRYCFVFGSSSDGSEEYWRETNVKIDYHGLRIFPTIPLALDKKVDRLHWVYLNCISMVNVSTFLAGAVDLGSFGKSSHNTLVGMHDDVSYSMHASMYYISNILTKLHNT